MAVFPDVIGSRRKLLSPIPVKRTKVGELHVVRYRKAVRPRYGFDLAWSLLTPTEAGQVDDHVVAHAGAGITFDWFDWKAFHWLWVPLGTGTGSAVVYTIPGKLTSDQEFFHSASTSIAGPVTSGTGANGEDQVTLTAPNGAPVWANFIGRRRFTMTFERDDQPLTRLLETGYYAFATRLMQAKS